ncbi:hypothetical protein [Streptomyces sp. NPDC060065]
MISSRVAVASGAIEDRNSLGYKVTPGGVSKWRSSSEATEDRNCSTNSS